MLHSPGSLIMHCPSTLSTFQSRPFKCDCPGRFAMQEDTPAWPQPMWGLFRLGRTGSVRSGHGLKGGTAWISAPGKTWAANRYHAARAIPNSASPPPSHTERLRNPTSRPATIRNDPQRSMILRRPSRAKSPFCPLTRCPASPAGIPGQVLHPPFPPGGAEDRVSESAVREASHIFGVGR
jgi:hypothetical protein